MNTRYIRTEKIIGCNATQVLKNSRVALFGLGGVGGYCCEALARAGIGTIYAVDADVVDESNLNRQLFATEKTVGMPKVEAARERIQAINSEVSFRTFPMFYLPETAQSLPLDEVDFVIDAIDTTTAKIHLAKECAKRGIPLVSSMGTGNKLHAEMLDISYIEDTEYCPLARILRRELKKAGVSRLQVVYSKEIPKRDPNDISRTPGSMPYVPGSAGFLLAEITILSLLGKRDLPIPQLR